MFIRQKLKQSTPAKHGMCAHAVASEPHEQHLGDVHKAKAEAVHAREDPVHLDRRIGVIGEHTTHAALLVALFAKGANHADADDALAQDHVHAVDETLHLLEDWGRAAHRDHGEHHDHGDHREHHGSHLRVDAEGQHRAHDADDGNRQHGLGGEHDRLLDDVHIV